MIADPDECWFLETYGPEAASLYRALKADLGAAFRGGSIRAGADGVEDIKDVAIASAERWNDSIFDETEAKIERWKRQKALIRRGRQRWLSEQSARADAPRPSGDAAGR